MNTINLTTELCAEDRARIDKLTATLEKVAAGLSSVGTPYDSPAAPMPDTDNGNVTLKEHEDFVEIVTEGTDLNDLTATGTYKMEPGPEAQPLAAPQHTKAELQQKVVSLVSAGKKEEVKEIIKQYAAKVSEVPAEKVDEVWDKLSKLEG